MSKDRDKAFRLFDSAGVDRIRREHSLPLPHNASALARMQRTWANEWLAQFDKAERESSEAEKAETKRMARSAKNAAWAAAIAAIVAAIAAIASAVIAFLPPSS